MSWSAGAAAPVAADGDQGTESDAPEITKLRFQSRPRAGRIAHLELEARDPNAAIAGVTVGWGDRSGVHYDYPGCDPHGDDPIGKPLVVRLRHRYKRGGRYRVTAKVDSTDCVRVETVRKSIRVRVLRKRRQGTHCRRG